MVKRYFIGFAAFAAIMVAASSCSDSVSYSELLNEEEEATNWFMANQKIVTEVPADSVFQYGEDAPYYRMDEDGFIYMQVINPGTKNNKAKDDELIYFRYMRTNIKEMYQNLDPSPEGNADDMGNASTSFRFKNLTLSSSYMYGSGIQLPLHYLGVDCEVNLVIRSYYGFTATQSECIPFVYNVKYYKGQM